jgi:hypothetical protein
MRKMRSGLTRALTAFATALAISMPAIGPSAAAPGNNGAAASGHQASRDLRLGGFAGAPGLHSTLAAARRRATDGVDIGPVLADPAIRRFIGPAEYAWDFNSPIGVPGFSPLPSIAPREPPRQLTAGEAALSARGPPAWVSTSTR